MKSADDWCNNLIISLYEHGLVTNFDTRPFIHAIQRDALLTVSKGVISMTGAPPWLNNPLGDEIIRRISEILPSED